MQSGENRVIVACAGSGKTTRLVDEALSRRDSRIAIITYTNNNAREILRKFDDRNGGVPGHVDVGTWFTFLLHHGARPYQRSLCVDNRIDTLTFVNKQSTRWTRKTDTIGYYFSHDGGIYSDKVSQFVMECDEASGRRVTGRLRQIYTDLFVDEFQDLAGWDLDVVETFLKSGIRVTLVGDPRQHIYSTNPSRRNSQYLGIKVLDLVNIWEKKGLCQVDQISMRGTYRCNQEICGFVNGLWPGVGEMVPLSGIRTGHDGVWLVSARVVEGYVERFRPQVLRHSKKSKSFGCEALNFGQAKGLEFDRVLIEPTETIRRYLRTGDLRQLDTPKGTSKDKLHVAVTRARHSVGFVYDGLSPVVAARWQAPG